MIIEPFRKEDTATFLELAASERWVSQQWEFEFLLSSFSGGCFCARDETGKGIGFVTSLLHERSGWIGNLIVSAEFRGRGVGEALFLRAVHSLREAGAETVWLTASKTGRDIYEKHGFATIDTIVRWTGFGRQRRAEFDPKTDSIVTSSVNAIDNQVWGDRRSALLAATAGRGELLIEESGFLVIQPHGDARQLGPFAALDNGTAEHIFDAALRAVPPGSKIFLDAPVSNRSALRLFNRRRMQIFGTNELMYAGVKPAYRRDLLYGLATMGSCG